jgi:hypothetical protein
MLRTLGFSILPRVRDRSLLLLVGMLCLGLLFALPSVASGGKKADGTLAVQDGKGVVQIAARGTIIGRIDQGTVLAIDRNPNDGSTPIVRGGRIRVVTLTRQVHQGRNIRFRLVGGFYRLRVQGRGISLSAVGRGSVTLNGDERFADTGLYSLNGGDWVPVPYDPETVQLAAPAPTGG